MVTVQEAPIVNPPETTGTSANEEPKSSVADISQRANGAAALNDCVNDSQKVFICLLSFVLGGRTMLANSQIFQSSLLTTPTYPGLLLDIQADLSDVMQIFTV